MKDHFMTIHTSILSAGGISELLQDSDGVAIHFDFNGFLGSFHWWNFYKNLNIEILDEQTEKHVFWEEFTAISYETALEKVEKALQVLSRKRCQ
jgi:hypothetical protein